MSIVVWDGISLAADRQATNSDMRIETRKIFRLSDDVVIAFTGGLAEVHVLLEWARKGFEKGTWPDFQKEKDLWCRMIVARKNQITIYETYPYPIEQYGTFCAWGVGRDFAIGALAMGADARKAVEVTSKYSTGCGMGVDVFKL